MPKFDLSKTQQVQGLFEVALAQRDQNWRERFYAAIVDASMATPPGQVLTGPDGFPYFVLNIPPAGQPFETFCVSHILDVCLENGFGVVIQPEANPPQWVFTYGNLWALKEFGKFEVEQVAAVAKTNGAAEGGVAPTDARAAREVFVGQPSESFFPLYARKAIKQFLVEKTGNSSPRVLLVNDPQMNPAESLVFSIFVEDFPSREVFEDVMHRLLWYLPRHYGMVSYAKDWELARLFEPL